jgi:small subunit ribosomal protein S14
MTYSQVFDKKTRPLCNLREERLQRVAFIKYALRRVLLKTVVSSHRVPLARKVAASYSLHRLPRSSSIAHQVNRCLRTARTHQVFRKQLLARMTFRNYAHRGVMPFLGKASW